MSVLSSRSAGKSEGTYLYSETMILFYLVKEGNFIKENKPMTVLRLLVWELLRVAPGSKEKIDRAGENYNIKPQGLVKGETEYGEAQSMLCSSGWAGLC